MSSTTHLELLETPEPLVGPPRPPLEGQPGHCREAWWGGQCWGTGVPGSDSRPHSKLSGQSRASETALSSPGPIGKARRRSSAVLSARVSGRRAVRAAAAGSRRS